MNLFFDNSNSNGLSSILDILKISYKSKQIQNDIPNPQEKNIYIVDLTRSNIDMFSKQINDIPATVKEYLRNNQMILIIFYPTEGFSLTMNDWVREIYAVLKFNLLSQSSVFLLYGNLFIKKEYKNFIKHENINPFKKVLGIDFWQFWYAHEYQTRIRDNYETRLEELSELIKQKDFLCLNGSTRPHRLLFCSELKRTNLEKNGFVSLVGRNYNPTDFHDVKRFLKNDQIKLNFYLDYLKDWKPQILDADLEDLKRDDRNVDKTLYKKTYYSVVTETLIDDDRLFLTEKTFKPIVNLHPFLILGNPGTLKYLQSCGYYTFPEIFDESYDSELDLLTRIDMILINIENFANLPANQKEKLIRRVQYKLKHNKSLFLSRNNKNNKKIKKVFLNL